MFNQKPARYLRLLKRNTLSPTTIFLGLLLFVLPTLAATPAPPQDFWDYLQDFSDENGNVLDPIEYDQLLNMKNSEISQTENQHGELDTSVDAQKLRHADMKIGTGSSTQASSSTKGEKL